MSSMNALKGVTVSSSSATESVQSQIQSVSAQITDISLSLSAATDALRIALQALAEIEASKPTEPGPKASKSEKAAYQSALQTWMSQRNDALQRVSQANQKIEQVTNQLEAAKSRLQTLQNSDLPAAERRDADAAAQQLKAQEDQLEAAGKSAEKEIEENADLKSDLQVKVAWKNLQVGDPSLKDVIRTFSLVVSALPSAGGNQYTGNVNAGGTGLPFFDDSKVGGASSAS